ncbi:hypothetical protein LKF67_0585 [Lactococcus lactis subsp. lactis]|nr:hypothetical protein LKF67_0585 [Lactococcus lactis subsp. lactis]
MKQFLTPCTNYNLLTEKNWPINDFYLKVFLLTARKKFLSVKF